MNKGKNNQHRVIVTTQHSTISEMKDDSLMIVPSLRESSTLVSYQVRYLDIHYSYNGICMYMPSQFFFFCKQYKNLYNMPCCIEELFLPCMQGVITDVVIPEIGVYELDNTVRYSIIFIVNRHNLYIFFTLDYICAVCLILTMELGFAQEMKYSFQMHILLNFPLIN